MKRALFVLLLGIAMLFPAACDRHGSTSSTTTESVAFPDDIEQDLVKLGPDLPNVGHGDAVPIDFTLAGKTIYATFVFTGTGEAVPEWAIPATAGEYYRIARAVADKDWECLTGLRPEAMHPGATIIGFAVAQDNASRVYAALSDDAEYHVVAVSTNGGATWSIYGTFDARQVKGSRLTILDVTLPGGKTDAIDFTANRIFDTP